MHDIRVVRLILCKCSVLEKVQWNNPVHIIKKLVGLSM